MNQLARIVEALLFLSADPLSTETLAEATETSEGEIVEALARLREHYAEGYRGVVLREVAGGFTLATDPVAENATGALAERGLIEESGRSQFGAVLYRTTELFQRLFGLSALDALPDPAAFDPSPEEEGELRERLLKAGEQRLNS